MVAPAAAVGIALPGGGSARLVDLRGRSLLALPPEIDGLAGEHAEVEGSAVSLVERTPANAARLRELVPCLRPRPVGTESSFGFGDRLGNATPGHVRALEATGSSLRPILAQQSARELDRTGRSWTAVLDAATWGALEAGWDRGYGADADHLRTQDEVGAALAAGFTMFTLDPSADVDLEGPTCSAGDLAEKVKALPWERLEDDWASVRRRHASAVGEEELARAAATWGAALACAAELARPLGGEAVDVEVSVDETPWPTLPAHARFLVAELRRLDVPFTSLAPRLPGRWEKGVDLVVDAAAIEQTLETHARLAAEHGPYKLSIHSGSDKFSVYPVLAGAELPLHVKTSGTSYLEALRVAAGADPALFRAVLEVGRAGFDQARGGYALGEAAGVPDQAGLADDVLVTLLDDPGTRQGLHVTFGVVWGAEELRRSLLALLEVESDTYRNALAAHLARHLCLLDGA